MPKPSSSVDASSEEKLREAEYFAQNGSAFDIAGVFLSVIDHSNVEQIIGMIPAGVKDSVIDLMRNLFVRPPKIGISLGGGDAPPIPPEAFEAFDAWYERQRREN